MRRSALAAACGIGLCAHVALAQNPPAKPPAANPPAAKTPSGAQLMQDVEDRPDGKDQEAKVTLQIAPKNGQKRFRELTLLRKEYPGETRLVTEFTSPADVRGAKFYVWDNHGKPDRRWIFLPAIAQTRQLASTDDRSSFFASDFVYEDLTNRDPAKDTHTFVASQKVGQWECWVVDSKPRSTSGVDFASYRSWIWKDTPIVIRQEFYDKAGKPVRRGNVVKLQKVQNIWTLHQTTVTNLKTGSTTLMEVSGVKYNQGVSNQRFIP